MEIRISTRQILTVLYVLAWVLFLGLCVEAGGFICNTFIVMVVNPAGANDFWNNLDLSALYKHDKGYFLIETSFMSVTALMKAWMFYIIMRILHDKKLDMSQPFSNDMKRFIFKISYLTLGIGLVSASGVRYAEWFVKQGVEMPDVQYLNLGGADVWLFMGVTLFIIGQIFKRGIEIQRENELTV
jgi:hypothetical protein